MVAIGGASEALLAAPGTMDLILNKRKGFVRVALTTGAHLVPVLSFGENDLFDPIAVEKHSLTWHSQQLTKSVLGFCVPPFVGRGLLGYPYGLLPKARPVVTVVGKPLPVPQWPGTSHLPLKLQTKTSWWRLFTLWHEKYLQAYSGLQSLLPE
ncbi:diacylglycerol O-acyltransferase 1 [Varicellaria rhodocarpa]|nr:diacylglycerol O-acyltransferase 1 [Varicellaria rhodocarpa]